VLRTAAGDCDPALPAQDSQSDARRVYADDVISLSSWHALQEHRPFGAILRTRLHAYRASSAFRHSVNGRPLSEPNDMDEMPT
jgi:hypothetical protein